MFRKKEIKKESGESKGATSEGQPPSKEQWGCNGSAECQHGCSKDSVSTHRLNKSNLRRTEVRMHGAGMNSIIKLVWFFLPSITQKPKHKNREKEVSFSGLTGTRTQDWVVELRSFLSQPSTQKAWVSDNRWGIEHTTLSKTFPLSSKKLQMGGKSQE